MSIVLGPGLVLSYTAAQRRIAPWILWRNLVTFTNISADESPSLATNMWNPQTSSYWVSETPDEQLIYIDNLLDELNAVGIARHNFGSNGTHVTIEAVTAESSPAYEVVAESSPGDDQPLLFRLPDQGYSAVRIRLGEAAGGLPHRVAVVMVGRLLVLPNGISPSYTPIQDAPDIELSSGRSQRGEFLGGWVLASGLETTTTITEVTDSWYRANMRPFLDYANRGGSFFWAWSPVVRPDDVSYSWFPRTARSRMVRSAPVWSVEMTMAGVDL